MSNTSFASSFLLLVFVSKVIVVVGAGRIGTGGMAVEIFVD